MDLGSFDNHWYTTLTPSEEEAVGDVLGHVPDDVEEMGAPEPPVIEFEDFYDDDRLTTSTMGSGVLPSQFTSQVYRIPNHKGVYAPFSFEGRRHMLAPYDSGAKEMLFCTARQVEKCVEVNSLISTAKGLRRAGDIRVGDRVLALHPTDKGVTWSTVTWVSKLLEKASDETVEIVDADGHRLVCGKEHPVRVYGAWKKAGELQVGDAIERAGRLDQGPVRLTLEGGVEAGLTMALWAAVGICCNTTAGRTLAVNIASAAGVSLLQEACILSGMRMTFVGRLFPNGGSRILLEGPLSGMLRRIAQGELPTIDPRFLPLFLHMLWASRGSITSKDCPRMHLPSWEMLEVVAALHEQAGVWVRQNPRRGTRSPYLSVVQPSFARFAELLPQSLKDALRPVGPRRTGVAIDTLPHGFVLRLVRLWQTRTPSDQDPGTTWAAMRCYPRDQRISRTRARELLTVLRRAPGIDRDEWADLLAEVESNTVWSTVTEVKEAGPRAMVDFTVEGSHSFVAQGFVTHNSTFLGNLLLNWSVWVPGHRSLYVSPSSIQTKTFSTDRLKEPIATSEFLRAYAAAGGHQNVHEIEFMNRSRITLRSAFLSADRCRGIPAYLLAMDEFQDMLPEHLPVIMPCTSHAPERWRRHVFTGTPKSFDNNMEFYRSGFNAEKPMSTMGEWMVPCDHCGSKTTGRFWQALGEENISKKGLVCSRCKQPIQAQNADAQWVHHQPDGRFESYRIPQLMVPWRNWHELYSDYVNYPKAKFYNEVLGLSMDDHSRPLSMSDIRACCDARVAIDTVHRFKPGNWHEPIFAGIDWGGGTSSYTVMVLATYIGGVFTVIWIKRFTGALLDVEEQIQYVLQTLREYNVELVGTDFGYGLQYNDTLIRRYGRDRVAVYQHLGRVTQKVFFDQKVGRFKVFRSMVMADFINMVKRKNIRLPRWEDFREPFAQDFCNITSHLSETQQMVVYTHRQDRPDDSFHAVLYCFLASYIRIPRPDILKPLHNRYRQEPVRSAVY